MRQHRATVYQFDARNRDGKQRVWTVYADSEIEAEWNAKKLCELFGAVFLGGITEGRTCVL